MGAEAHAQGSFTGAPILEFCGKPAFEPLRGAASSVEQNEPEVLCMQTRGVCGEAKTLVVVRDRAVNALNQKRESEGRRSPSWCAEKRPAEH